MYKLFLCLKYLRSRVIAYFAVLGVMLCVAMMVIVVSVMTGFVNKIEVAAKGLSGDITMDSGGRYGIGYYDEFISKVSQDVPELQAAVPYISSYGFIRLNEFPHYRHPVQVSGIRLPDHAKVSDFDKGLFAQKGAAAPTWNPDVKILAQAIENESQKSKALIDSLATKAELAGPRGAEARDTMRKIQNARIFQNEALLNLEYLDDYRRDLDQRQKELQQLQEQGADDATLEKLEKQVSRLNSVVYESPEYRTVLGLGIPSLSFRTPKGETVRLWLPGKKILLYIFPLGTRSLDMTSFSPELGNFSVIDDCTTDVASIDSATVYIPFDTLQKLNHMGAQFAADDPTKEVVPPRCSQILFKANDGCDLDIVSAKIKQSWNDFIQKHPQAASMDVQIETWRQRQRSLVNAIESQRTLMVIILGIISMVALVLIFVIFYMIVMQKTRDIGVLKAIGASSSGVAGIFLAYGAAVGVVGSLLGTTAGYFFVININPISDWIADTFGFRVWDREFFMFDKIPNEVQFETVLAVFIGAVIAGTIGSLVPAMRAARMQPVEALRYE